METNNKYYTPEISEFYIGFEYQCKSTFHDGTVKTQEQFDDDIKYKWNDTKVDSIQDLSYVQRSLHGRNAELNRCGTRVKFLDKEDIESFKFKTQDGKEHIHETDDLLFFVIWNGKDEFGITYNKKEHYIKTIKHFSGLHNMNECWMPINIKNKSELKVLLKQLNIY